MGCTGATVLYFHYQSADGVISRRQLDDYVDCGVYLRGHDMVSGDFKTFRKERILRFFSCANDNDYLSAASIKQKPIVRAEAAHADFSFEICFTGFPAEEKQALTQRAIQANMKVVKSVTIRLSFLCAGANAGRSKMLKAEEQGALIITSVEFLALVEEGVMPEGYTPKELYLLEEGHGAAHAIIDPIVFFADWKYPPKAVLWSAFGIMQAERKGHNGKYVYTYEPENALLQEGDVFYMGNEQTGLQVIHVGDGVEVMHFSKQDHWHALGYLITPEQLVKWLKLGEIPPSHCQISKNQSKSQIAQFYEYSE